MSELKARMARSIADEEEILELGADSPIESAQVYLKSEADKVIALLTDKANYNDYAYKHKSEELADTCRFYEEELRHQKRKRCLAMAKWCNEKWLVHNFAEVPTKLGFYDKWEKRWLELAEKFK